MSDHTAQGPPNVAVPSRVLKGRLCRRASAAALLLAAGTWGLGLGRRVEPGGQRQAAVEAFGSGAPVSQTFLAPGDGLEGVTVFVRSDDPGGPRGSIRMVLSVRREGIWVPLYGRVIAVERQAVTLAFPLLAHAAGESFRLEVQQVGPSRVPLALDAFADGGIRPGVLTIDGREQWGDLRLRLRLASRYRTFMARTPAVTGWERLPALHLVLALVYVWAMASVLDGLLWDRQGGDPATGNDGPREAAPPPIKGERWGRTG